MPELHAALWNAFHYLYDHRDRAIGQTPLGYLKTWRDFKYIEQFTKIRRIVNEYAKLVVATLPQEYGFTNVDGKQPKALAIGEI